MKKVERIPKKIRFQIYQNLFEIIKYIVDNTNENEVLHFKLTIKGKTLPFTSGVGFCGHIYTLYTIYFPTKNPSEIYSNFKFLFPELYKKKPTHTHTVGFWGTNIWRLNAITTVLGEEEIKCFYRRLKNILDKDIK